MPIIEFLTLLIMIFIISFINSWHFKWNDIESILLFICFINILFPNLAFFKSFWMSWYSDIMDNDYMQYIFGETNYKKQIDKIFCVLLCNNSLAKTFKNDSGNN